MDETTILSTRGLSGLAGLVILLAFLVLSVSTGRFRFPAFEVDRNASPRLYYLVLALYSALLVGCALAYRYVIDH